MFRHNVPDLFSAKTGNPGMNLQIAATIKDALVAVGPIPVPGARHRPVQAIPGSRPQHRAAEVAVQVLAGKVRGRTVVDVNA